MAKNMKDSKAGLLTDVIMYWTTTENERFTLMKLITLMLVQLDGNITTNSSQDFYFTVLISRFDSWFWFHDSIRIPILISRFDSIHDFDNKKNWFDSQFRFYNLIRFKNFISLFWFHDSIIFTILISQFNSRFWFHNSIHDFH